MITRNPDNNWSGDYPTMAFEKLRISNAQLSGEFFVYGVRYYQGKRLTTEREYRNGSMVVSELEKNFETDSKRYNIPAPAI